MVQSSSSKNKLVKPLKNCFIRPNLHKYRVIMGTAQNGKQFFFLAEITKKQAISFQKLFYFIKISYVWTELWIFFYLKWCFLSKKCHFQLKQLWQIVKDSLKTYSVITSKQGKVCNLLSMLRAISMPNLSH